MTVKAIVSEQEFAALPEQIAIPKAQAYAKGADGYVFQVEPVSGYELKPVANLMSALDKERAAAAAAAARIKDFDGLDAKAARDALALVDEYKKSDPTERAKKAFEADARKLVEDNAKLVEAEKSRVAKLTAQIERQIRTGAARDAIAKAKGNVDLLLPHVESRIKTKINENGEVVAYVANDHGTEATSLNASGQIVPMTFDGLVESFKNHDAFASAFAGTGARGSGGGAMNGASNSGAFTISEAQARNDPRAYQAVKARAEAAGAQIQVVN